MRWKIVVLDNYQKGTIREKTDIFNYIKIKNFHSPKNVITSVKWQVENWEKILLYTQPMKDIDQDHIENSYKAQTIQHENGQKTGTGIWE